MSQTALEMVETQLVRRGIRDARVLEAMAAIPREQFVPEEFRDATYADAPLPIGFGQTITQPYMTALMLELLELRGDEKVLEVGTGSGYHAALLGALAARVISVERVPELCVWARANLRLAGLDSRITVLCADGSLGVPEESPFQRISVAAASPSVPRALLDQLDDPGILVIPVGSRGDQDLRVIHKENGNINSRTASACRFVPLIGREGWQEN